MSKFHKLLNRAYREIITEQDQPPIQEDPNVAAQNVAPQNVQPEQGGPTAIEEIPEQGEGQEKDILSPEGMVFLVRLLSKALMIDTLDTSEEALIADIGEIDEYNAKDTLKRIIPIVQKYAPSSEKLPKI
jgi:hypothetical protein